MQNIWTIPATHIIYTLNLPLNHKNEVTVDLLRGKNLTYPYLYSPLNHIQLRRRLSQYQHIRRFQSLPIYPMLLEWKMIK